jgi:hypothetical protein
VPGNRIRWRYEVEVFSPIRQTVKRYNNFNESWNEVVGRDRLRHRERCAATGEGVGRGPGGWPRRGVSSLGGA